MNSDIQTYALLYCQYDGKSGSRRYDLLAYDTIAELDIAVAKIAISKEPLPQVVKIIYFGSLSLLNNRAMIESDSNTRCL